MSLIKSCGILRRFVNTAASNSTPIGLRRFLNTAASDSRAIPYVSQQVPASVHDLNTAANVSKTMFTPLSLNAAAHDSKTIPDGSQQVLAFVHDVNTAGNDSKTMCTPLSPNTAAYDSKTIPDGSQQAELCDSDDDIDDDSDDESNLSVAFWTMFELVIFTTLAFVGFAWLNESNTMARWRDAHREVSDTKFLKELKNRGADERWVEAIRQKEYLAMELKRTIEDLKESFCDRVGGWRADLGKWGRVGKADLKDATVKFLGIEVDDLKISGF
ncbi:hypothetical protein FNV43_RR14144 [Rhamnella rubrinervis]|uniref:Uncharacterized protein n=1 Tax=Rhamnella rubrinervis TaxID=2594499 RepID=A0A8K0H2B1_9ROSA|nr:hypothetical protein FNV43_RR14144 [Rhamnella rubrinervis]